MRHGRSHPWMVSTFFLVALAATQAHPQTAGRIAIDGSTGVMPLAASLATAFRERNPGVVIEIGKGLGTQARIQALAEGKIDVALASHGLDAAELGRQGMVAHEIARVPVVFGVNASVPVADLTDQQVCDIYAGRSLNWQIVGGPSIQIAARTRPDSEVDAEVVRSHIPCLKDLKFPDAVKVMPKAGDMAEELATTDGAIGMTTMTVVQQSGGRSMPSRLTRWLLPQPTWPARSTHLCVHHSS